MRGSVAIVAVAAGIGAAAAATVQFAADGAYGKAAAAPSVPHAIAGAFGEGPAKRLGIAPRGETSDAAQASEQIDRLDARGDYRSARDQQRDLVECLRAQSANPEVLANALWRLGQLDAETGYREPANRRSEWPLALRDYQEALDMIPLSVTILLAAGNQALLDGDRTAAADYFRRALASDPSSAAARDGLHRAQTGEGVPPPFVAPAEWNVRKSASP